LTIEDRHRLRSNMRRSVLALVLAFCAGVPSVQLAGTYTVVGVEAIDGDSIEVRFPSDLLVEVRLLSIDCPEHGQPISDDAVEFTRRFVKGRLLTLETGAEERDHYNRLLAMVTSE
jgi:endonuclease YncB( thermonuclease family)